MKLIWTRSTLPFSKLICWGLGEDSSHFALVFDDCLLFQSNLLGSHISFYPTFERGVEVVHEILVPMDEEAEERVYKNILSEFDGYAYDYGAFAYFCWRVFLRKVFGRPLPVKNWWGNENTYLCVELAAALDTEGVPDNVRRAVQALPYTEMTSPTDLYRRLRANL